MAFQQVTWKRKLRDRFKTKRHNATDKATSAPPAKRPRLDLEESFEKNVESLREEMRKRRRDRNVAVIQSLTLDTFAGRHSWIQR